MAESSLQTGARRHGFTLLRREPVTELNLTFFELRHDQTGARMVHLEAQDDNNLFGVGFHTTPSDSTGVAHILEHTVLCGSQRYPVRDPFFTMLKRSLSTFMNALTSSDWTLYPFSTQNESDFYNLMGVYLDAAFFPRLLERDFRQEGHRLEFADQNDPDSPLTYKGVVYNEMKGAMSDPSSLLYRRLNRILYPTTTYGHNSGGEPQQIPTLSYQALQDFHATYYHPANAYFFTYGNLPLEGHLKAIDELALSRFSSQEPPPGVTDERRYGEPQRLTETFPVDEGEPLERRSMVHMAWLNCPVADHTERLAMKVLSTLLLGNPAAPLYQALIESRLGQNLTPGSGYHDDNRETFFAAGLQGTEPHQAGAVEELILKTLERAAREGFPSERVEAAMHQMEFAQREVTGDAYPYPLNLLMRILGPWIHSGDPLGALRLEEDLKQLRRQVGRGGFFEELVRRQLLDNPHRVTLTLKPDAKQKEREEQETARQLEKIKAELSTEEKERIVARAKELKEAQEAKEDVSCLPCLDLDEIPEKERGISGETEEISGISVHRFDQPTNGIGYFIAHLDPAALTSEQLPYLPLFCTLFSQIGAAGQSYLQIAERISATTGGIRAVPALLENPKRQDDFRLAVEVRGKALIRNQQPMFDILRDLFTAPDFTDLDRLHAVINQVKISFENAIPGSGHSFALRAASARLSASGSLRESWAGITQLRLVREIAARRPDQLQEVADIFAAIAGALLTAKGMECAITGEGQHLSSMSEALGSFIERLPRPALGGSPLPLAKADGPTALGLAGSYPVSYVVRAFSTVPYTHPDAPGMLVLARLLRAGFLHREIREKGGAYGGMASFDAETGIFALLSYRDPQLSRTLEVYRQALDWACSGDFDDQQLKEAKLAVFSDLDRPPSPGGKGGREFTRRRQGLTREMRNALRRGVLEIDSERLAALADRHLLQNWNHSAVAVISSEQALHQANRKLGPEAHLAIERI